MSNNCANIDHVNRTIINLIQQQLEIRQKYRYIYSDHDSILHR